MAAMNTILQTHACEIGTTNVRGVQTRQVDFTMRSFWNRVVWVHIVGA